MTQDCIDNLNKLRKENKTFEELTIEQLLFEAIRGSDLDEVKSCLNDTNWQELFDIYEPKYKTKYYLKSEWENEYTEVTKDVFVSVEHGCGFKRKDGDTTKPATSGFISGAISGKIETKKI